MMVLYIYIIEVDTTGDIVKSPSPENIKNEPSITPTNCCTDPKMLWSPKT